MLAVKLLELPLANWACAEGEPSPLLALAAVVPTSVPGYRPGSAEGESPEEALASEAATAEEDSAEEAAGLP